MSKDRTVRDDLSCERCGEEFAGRITETLCPSCQEALDEGGSVTNERPAPEPTQEGYVKQVKTEPRGNRINRRADPEKLAKAETESTRALETTEERARKIPLREELLKLRAERAAAGERIEEIDARISELATELRPRPDDPTQKNCFGVGYDRGDEECLNLCPLAVECEETCRASGTGIFSDQGLVSGSVQDR